MCMQSTYLKGGGRYCPVCGSNNIMFFGEESVSPGPLELQREIECHDCGSEWKDEYQLTGFIDLIRGTT